MGSAGGLMANGTVSSTSVTPQQHPKSNSQQQQLLLASSIVGKLPGSSGSQVGYSIAHPGGAGTKLAYGQSPSGAINKLSPTGSRLSQVANTTFQAK